MGNHRFDRPGLDALEDERKRLARRSEGAYGSLPGEDPTGRNATAFVLPGQARFTLPGQARNVVGARSQPVMGLNPGEQRELQQSKTLNAQQLERCTELLLIRANQMMGEYGKNIVDGLGVLEKNVVRRALTPLERSLILERVIVVNINTKPRLQSLRVHLKTQPLTERGKNMLHHGVPIGQEQLTFDAFLEQVAVRLAYSNAPNLEASNVDSYNDPNDVTNKNNGKDISNPKNLLATFGYAAPKVILGRWGLEFRVFHPIQPGKPNHNKKYQMPIVAFRGTESFSPFSTNAHAGTDTNIGDVSPAGVGYSQYRPNKDLVDLHVKHAAQSSPSNKVVFTGHSLGGALAQIAAVKHLENTSRIVTFQSPGINKGDVEKLEGFNKTHKNKDGGNTVESTHYRIEDDIVATAGQAMTTGEILVFNRDPGGMTRAGANHVTFGLHGFLKTRDQSLNSSEQQSILEDGAADPATWQSGTKVSNNFTGVYDTELDPRSNLEGGRKAVGGLASQLTLMNAFMENAVVNVLTEHVEGLARQHKTYPAFLEVSTRFLDGVVGKKMPLTEDALELAKELGLQEEVVLTGTVPGGLVAPPSRVEVTPFGKAKRDGILVLPKFADTVRNRFGSTWESWRQQ